MKKINNTCCHSLCVSYVYMLCYIKKTFETITTLCLILFPPSLAHRFLSFEDITVLFTGELCHLFCLILVSCGPLC